MNTNVADPAELLSARERAVLTIQKPSPNALGAGAFKPQAAALKANPAALARRYKAALLEVTDLPAIRAIALAIARTQQMIDQHSPVIYEERIRELSRLHAENPCERTLRALRDGKILDSSDSARVQEMQVVKLRSQLAQLGPLILPIYRRLADLLQLDVDAIEARTSAEYESFEASPVASALSVSLCGFLAEIRVIVHAVQPKFSNIPPIVSELLRISPASS